ncbi:hypothetical protein BSKO_04197 [Bryopsis sp. KO-2023]|nr:hypothetical protein BSKO_04197 [Bryopsis sp. KO-2023]
MAHVNNTLGLRLIESLVPFGQAYIRFRFTEYWASYKVCEIILEAHKLYRKWRSVPKYVEMLRSDDVSVRIDGAMELEMISLRNTGTRAFSLRSVEQGSLPGLVSLLHSGSPAAVSAALCVLCDVYGHPKCADALEHSALRQVFVLTAADDLFCRLRACLFLALLATESSMEVKLQGVVKAEPAFLKQLTNLIRRPLPERFQNVLDNPPAGNNATHLHLRIFESQLRKAGVTTLYQVIHADELLDKVEFRLLVPYIVRSVRDKDAGLRNSCRGCLKSFAKKEEARKVMGDSAVRFWSHLMPRQRDLDCLGVIEDLGVYPDLRERLIHDGYFLHRLPGLLTSRKKEIKITAFRSLFPFTLSTHHRWKLVKSGLLHLIIDGLYNRNKSVYIAAIICLSQLCVSPEVFLAVQAEFGQRKSVPARVGEYLIYLALCYPDEDLGKGGLKLLTEVAPRLKNLPNDVMKKLRSSLFDKDIPRQAGTARLVSQIAQVEKFRVKFLKLSIVTDILLQMKNGPERCKAAMVEALACLSKDKATAERVAKVKGLTEALWRAQETNDDELAVAALELLRVLSNNVTVGSTDITLSVPEAYNC